MLFVDLTLNYSYFQESKNLKIQDHTFVVVLSVVVVVSYVDKAMKQVLVI